MSFSRLLVLGKIKILVEISGQYQNWYTRSLPVIQQLLPDRYTEYPELYRKEKKKELNASNYSISDFHFGFSSNAWQRRSN